MLSTHGTHGQERPLRSDAHVKLASCGGRRKYVTSSLVSRTRAEGGFKAANFSLT